MPLHEHLGARRGLVGGGALSVGTTFDPDGQRVQPVDPLQDALEVRRKGWRTQDEFLDLGGEEVDAAQDDHVIRPASDLLHPSYGPGGAWQQPGEVPRAIADHRHCLLGERREDQLALLAVRQYVTRDWIDHLWIEVVLPDMQAVFVSTRSLATPGPITSDSP